MTQTETPSTTQPSAPAGERAPRKARSDAARNRQALLAAAADAFTELGADAPLEEIARRAGVGIGTLYRHFPNRDALREAAYRNEVDTLCDRVDELASLDPVEALSTWMRSFTAYVARKRGMAMALKSALGADNELFQHSHQRISAAIGTLVSRAVEAGEIRSDVAPDDLMRAMGGICMATDTPGWSERVGAIVDLLIDGLRYRAPARS